MEFYAVLKLIEEDEETSNTNKEDNTEEKIKEKREKLDKSISGLSFLL